MKVKSKAYICIKDKGRNLKERKEGCMGGGGLEEELAELFKQGIYYLKILHKPTFLCKNTVWSN